jgi:hypothetical protein
VTSPAPDLRINAPLNLIGVYSAASKILMVISAECDVKPDQLRFLNKRFIESLTVIYKEFGVIGYEFFSTNRFAILRHGELIVNRITVQGTEKTHTVLLDLEIDRIFPLSATLAFQSTKFENNSLVKVNESAAGDKQPETKLAFSGIDKDLIQVLRSESGTKLACVYSDKLVFYSQGDLGQSFQAHEYKNLRVN